MKLITTKSITDFDFTPKEQQTLMDALKIFNELENEIRDLSDEYITDFYDYLDREGVDGVYNLLLLLTTEQDELINLINDYLRG
jgi:hypothetical protein